MKCQILFSLESKIHVFQYAVLSPDKQGRSVCYPSMLCQIANLAKIGAFFKQKICESDW